MIKSKMEINRKAVSYTKFPGGEVKVEVPFMAPGFANIHFKSLIKSSDDLMATMMMADAIKRRYPNKKLLLDIPYIPYARQDRVCNRGEALSLKVVATMINSIGADRVLVCDPHSDVSTALINNVSASPCDLIRRPSIISDKTLIAPDAGAEKRVMTVARACKAPMITATKVRDVKTGEIVDTKVNDKVGYKDYLIVDDICDGGRTFIELAKVLKLRGAKSVSLYVTHGIFSQGKEVLSQYIDNIHAQYDWTQYAN